MADTKFVDGEHYWLKIKNSEKWMVGRCYISFHSKRFNDPEPIQEIIFEQIGCDCCVWRVDDFTESIHIPRPENKA